jgi:predicted dienelactone hydrolase
MYLLEAFIYILTITLFGILISKKAIKKQYVIALLIVTVLVVVLHVIIDGIRWQLYLLYLALFLISILITIKTFLIIDLKKNIKIISNIVLISLFSFSLIAAIVFPIYELPTPSGEYLIGTESFVIEDENRFEHYGDDSTEYRRIKIQIWYPAESIEGYEQVPWLEDGTDVSRGLSKDYGFPTFMLDHMANIMSNSYLEAPISSSLPNYPVIIISHGWSGFRNLHTDYAEELASLGYIVIGIDHTYGSVATVFGENDITYKNPDALPSRETTTDFLEYANQLVYTYASDITLTIDYLESLNDNTIPSRFNGKFNLDKIGLLGHSTGAGAGAAVAINDDRIDAIIGLDPWVEPIDATEIDKGLLVPSLFLRSEMWETGDNNINLYSIIENSAFDSTLYQIDGTTHFDFTMIYMFSPLTKYIGMSGTVEDEYLNSILKSMISDFFNQTLKNDTTSQINIESWKEVRVIPVQ